MAARGRGEGDSGVRVAACVGEGGADDDEGSEP